MNILKGFAEFAHRRRGFRLSITDLIAASVCAATTWLLGSTLGLLVWLLPITLGHFFLFCNVFRVVRRHELIWALLFVLNVSFWATAESFAWGPVILLQCPVTVAVIVAEIRSSRYHGIFCREFQTDD